MDSEFHGSKAKESDTESTTIHEESDNWNDALNGISVLELNGLEALERVVIMRGGLSGGSGRLRVTNCANLSSIDIGELAFMKYKNLELTNLPLLQRISIGSSAFQNIQTIVMESNEENEVRK